MLEASRPVPGEFAGHAATLFAAMKDGGRVGFTAVDWFNGGLFDDATALPLERADLDDLLEAARLDWSQIDPSILGTLFERGLDPGKRSQLGAHYTDRDKIMKIVGPVIVEPLLAEWAEVRGRIEALLDAAPKATAEKLLRGAELAARTRAFAAAEALHRGFLDRLKAFRVLDPACGSGNFLYLSLRALKDIEHRANLEAEALGLPRGFPQVGPEAVRGIELNPYAAELARVSVDRRDPVDARQRLRRLPQPDPAPARHHRVPRRDPERGRDTGRMAGSGRGGGEPAVSRWQEDALRNGRRLHLSPETLVLR
jgi:hypothetical protein